MNNKKIEMIKKYIRDLNKLFDLGVILKDKLDNLICLVDKYRKELSERKIFSIYESMEDDYIFDLVDKKVKDINSTLDQYIDASIGLSGIGYMADDLHPVVFYKEDIKKDKYQNPTNSIKMITLNKKLRDLKEDINLRERKIEFLEKKAMDKLRIEKDGEKFDQLIEKIDKLGKL